uniref:Uncharacterized protein n=1 Tax=Lepeophtheirus salmonis TaxID=72036 RepID=A0A0K2V6J9_LEPSM
MSEVMNPCSIHCHLLTPEFWFVTLNHAQTLLRIISIFLFLVDSEQTQDPLFTKVTHGQMFMQYKGNTFSSYIYDVI